MSQIIFVFMFLSVPAWAKPSDARPFFPPDCRDSLNETRPELEAVHGRDRAYANGDEQNYRGRQYENELTDFADDGRSAIDPGDF